MEKFPYPPNVPGFFKELNGKKILSQSPSGYLKTKRGYRTFKAKRDTAIKPVKPDDIVSQLDIDDHSVIDALNAYKELDEYREFYRDHNSHVSGILCKPTLKTLGGSNKNLKDAEVYLSTIDDGKGLLYYQWGKWVEKNGMTFESLFGCLDDCEGSCVKCEHDVVEEHGASET